MRLNPRHIRFLEEFAKTVDDTHPRGNAYAAYKKVYNLKTTNEATIRTAAARLKRGLFSRADIGDLLSATGLGLDRFAVELNKRLDAERPMSVGGEIKYVEDNHTRMAATSLLADVLGVRKRDSTFNYNINQTLKALVVEVRPDEQPNIRGYECLRDEFNRLIPGAQDRIEGPPGAVFSGQDEVPGDVRVDSVGQDDPGVSEGDTLQPDIPDELRDRAEEHVPRA